MRTTVFSTTLARLWSRPHLRCVFVLLLLVVLGCGKDTNVILMIGDGMGPEYVKAARTWNDGKLAMDTMPARGWVTTHAADGAVTDSAAAATALATGYKTLNGRIAVAPDGSHLPTILEMTSRRGYSSGLVTTTRLTHATPACFAAHVDNRANEEEIARQLLLSNTDVMLGGGRARLSPRLSTYAGDWFLHVGTRRELIALNPQAAAPSRVIGLFAESGMTWEKERDQTSEPSIAEMTEKALQLLAVRDAPFFLMVEGGRIDHAAHGNDSEKAIAETIAFDRAVGVALAWAAKHQPTLVVVTADHETGGMKVVSGPGGPTLQFSTSGHTGVRVPVFAYGSHAESFEGELDNTDIPKRIAKAIGLEGFPAQPVASSARISSTTTLKHFSIVSAHF